MDFDEEKLAARLTSRADLVAASPDVAAVIEAADRSRRRSRLAAMTGAAAVVALGVAGVVMVAQRDVAEAPSAAPVATEAAPADTAVVAPATDGTPVVDDGPVETGVPAPTPTFLLPQADPIDPDPGGSDPADPYLDRTTEVYRRTMPDGYDLQIRQSDLSYGDLFDVDWKAPTGSRQECLGSPALLIGDPGGPRQGMSSWQVRHQTPLQVGEDFRIEQFYRDRTVDFVIRTDLPATEATIEFDGATSDSASFANGLAVVEMPDFFENSEHSSEPLLSVAVEGEAEPRIVPFYSEFDGYTEPGDPCQPPPQPTAQLPAPGVEQPVGARAAEVSIRQRHTLLVDRTQTPNDKPGDLLDDDTGVAEARAEMEAGSFADAAAEAEYTIDELVFTDATTAWFDYTIVTSSGTFAGRFGEAVYNGTVWQITRTTICQDLQLAGGNCNGGGDPVETQQPPGVSEADMNQQFEEWNRMANLYYEPISCNPINPCIPDFGVGD